MKLTGKCKEEFEKWLRRWLKENVAWECETPQQEDVDHFYKFPDSMQWGVYLDFFDSVDINLDNIFENEVFYLLNTFQKGDVRNFREEARTAAIEKANEIYNNQ